MSVQLALKDGTMYSEHATIKPVHSIYIDAFEAYDNYLRKKIEEVVNSPKLSPAEKNNVRQILEKARHELFVNAENALKKAR